jgi:putative ABC transport system permease protein
MTATGERETTAPAGAPGRTIPLAWRNLTENPWRLLASVAGTAFAVVLMFVENGFRDALLDNMVAVVSGIDGDLFLTHRGRYILSQPVLFPRRRLAAVLGTPGVASMHAFYLDADESTRWRHPLSGMTRAIRVLAYRPEDDLLRSPEVRSQRVLWDRPDAALADRQSKPSLFGTFRPGEASELRGKRVEVVGLFSLGTDFRSNGTLLVSEANYLRYAPERQPSRDWGDTLIDAGVVRLAPGADPDAVRSEAARKLPPDVILLTRDELMRKEQEFWEKVTPVGVVFDIGLVMGLIVGSAICYQVLFGEVADRLAEFATLKAMGYRDRALGRIIVEEAVYLALMGFAAGLVLSWGLFRVLERQTGLNMAMSPGSVLLVLVLTVVMCVSAGLLAARKLTAVDPAELFA